MQLAVTTDAGDFYSIDVDPSIELENVKALIEAESSIPAASQQLYFNGQPLTDDKKSLSACGIKVNDILLVRRKSPAARSANGGDVATGGAAGPQSVAAETERFRQELLQNPAMMQQMAGTDPALVEAALNNPQRFAQMMQALMAESQRNRALAALESADPFDVEAQRKIEEMIQQQNIQQNMETALEYNPEAFGRVIMLYIDCEVNGKPVKAFVDSGAQSTIMSPECAEACGIMHLCDRRFAGIAKGVGTAKILGRVHAATIKVGNNADAKKNLFLQCSFTIMEGKDVDLLWGLDNLKRFEACIDLKKNVLRFGDDVEIPFLSEKDLPEKARVKEPSPEEKEGGAGTGASGTAGASNSATAAATAGSSNTSAAKPATGSQSPTKAPATATAGPSSPSQPVTAAVPTPAAKFPEADIASLVSLGASRAQAVNVLEATGGNVEAAASLLFSAMD